MNQEQFQHFVIQKGHELYRDMPWRDDTRPYYVLVSELMLQQTQVSRVIPKFEAFVDRFPDERTLAGASLGEVLKLWQGLGYNRRAKFLHESAKRISEHHQGAFPTDKHDILALPGVGSNTAGAIMAYAFNQPVVFVETNIRTVYIHHFFSDNFEVDDKQIIELVKASLDREHPREFYWALMDYGASLKSAGVRNIDRSRHYKRQSALRGSIRETRGEIIRQLTQADASIDTLRKYVAMDDRFEQALHGLVVEGLVQQTNGQIHLTK